jgi:DNA (cytosine-5)-methyltransferase 1
MRYGSVCSGIEAATVAWHPLGWKPEFFAEIDKFPSLLLKHYYPDVPALLTPNGGRAGIGVGAVAISANQRGELRERPVHGSLSASKSTKQFDGIMQHMAVRRLTPRECERLQGFPGDYTLVPFGKKPAADGPRYKALGNSMAVPCMRWIGERIQMVDSLCARK